MKKLVILLFSLLIYEVFASPFEVEDFDIPIKQNNSLLFNKIHFKEVKNGQFKITNIQNAVQLKVDIKTGDNRMIEGTKIELIKCFQELNEPYNPFSIAYILVDNQQFTVSNNASLSDNVNAKFFVWIKCTE